MQSDTHKHPQITQYYHKILFCFQLVFGHRNSNYLQDHAQFPQDNSMRNVWLYIVIVFVTEKPDTWKYVHNGKLSDKCNQALMQSEWTKTMPSAHITSDPNYNYELQMHSPLD